MTQHKYISNSIDTVTHELIALALSLMNSLHQVSVQAQDDSGQVFIGLIKTAFSCHL